MFEVASSLAMSVIHLSNDDELFSSNADVILFLSLLIGLQRGQLTYGMLIMFQFSKRCLR